jgi:hypothetical protein
VIEVIALGHVPAVRFGNPGGRLVPPKGIAPDDEAMPVDECVNLGKSLLDGAVAFKRLGRDGRGKCQRDEKGQLDAQRGVGRVADGAPPITVSVCGSPPFNP